MIYYYSDGYSILTFKTINQMPQSKIEFRLGAIHFIGEGEKAWVTKQLDKIISQAPSLLRIAGTDEDMPSAVETGTAGKRGRPAGSGKGKTSPAAPMVASAKSNISAKDLPAYIKARNAGANQRMKFLATAGWLASKGKKSFVTRDVTKAIKAAKLPELINPSQYLGQNLKQGYFKKAGSEFILSNKGMSAL